MAKNTIADLDVTAANNTDVLGESTQGTNSANRLDEIARNTLGLLARFYTDLGGVVTVGGTADAITVTSTSTYQALENGLVIAFKAASANTTAATLNLDSLGVKAIRRQGDSALTAGDIAANGVYLLRYDTAYNSAAGAWVLLNPTVVSSTASTTEVLTGTDTAKLVTSNALAALWEKGSDVASATTVSLGEGGFFHITGTTTITDIDFATAKDGRMAWLEFDGALTLTHNATTLDLPGDADITTVAGDRALVVQDSSDNVHVLAYQRAALSPDNVTLATAQATTSGTAIDFTGLPAGTKRIVVSLAGVSTNGTSPLLVQIGDSGGIEATGYTATGFQAAGSTSGASYTAGFGLSGVWAASDAMSGALTLSLLDASTNTWTATFTGSGGATTIYMAAGSKALSATLDRVRLTTVGGANTFDAGSVNILYEG